MRQAERTDMAFDGIVTYGIATELSKLLTLGKIEKIYQPGNEELLLQIHTKSGNLKLIASCGSQSARICLTNGKYENPAEPPTFCMLLRKHIQGGRITGIRQNGSERMIEIDIEAQTELGFSVSKRLIIEIMGKHSNIVLVDIETGKIVDSIKRISIDVNRFRQLLPGVVYKYPPAQDKIPFKEVSPDLYLENDPKVILSRIAGISPAIARELANSESPAERLREITASIEDGSCAPVIYFDEKDIPREFHLTALAEYEPLQKMSFDSLSECVEHFFSHRISSNMIRQKSLPLMRSTKAALEKAELKKQRLSEDLLRAEDSEDDRLFGEFLTANIHLIAPGEKRVTVTNYYTGEPVSIPLSEKLSPSKNAQRYFKRYSKAKTAIREKTVQLEETTSDIEYLQSVLLNIQNAGSEDELRLIREELTETGYVKRRSQKGARPKKSKPSPIEYTLTDGTTIFVGRNNKENDWLTMKFAAKNDLWFHTKDIPGSHVIMPLQDGKTAEDISAEIIYEAASAAAYHSKAQDSANVPVDFAPVRHVKKPNGAKPGMVIFTHNTTVYVDPKVPDKK